MDSSNNLTLQSVSQERSYLPQVLFSAVTFTCLMLSYLATVLSALCICSDRIAFGFSDCARSVETCTILARRTGDTYPLSCLRSFLIE